MEHYPQQKYLVMRITRREEKENMAKSRERVDQMRKMKMSRESLTKHLKKRTKRFQKIMLEQQFSSIMTLQLASVKGSLSTSGTILVQLGMTNKRNPWTAMTGNARMACMSSQ